MSKSIHHDESSGDEAWLPVLHQQLKGLRFGVVQLVVHEARIVQIERTEKTRLDKAASEVQGGGDGI